MDVADALLSCSNILGQVDSSTPQDEISSQMNEALAQADIGMLRENPSQVEGVLAQADISTLRPENSSQIDGSIQQEENSSWEKGSSQAENSSWDLSSSVHGNALSKSGIEF